MSEFDAVVVGSGPNGLAAAITMQQQGLSVLLVEAKDTIGGGLRTKELTLPGFKHDVCSAIHPLAVGSPFLKTLPLEQHGLKFIYPEIPAAHPLDGGRAAVLHKSFRETINRLGKDGHAYEKLIGKLVDDWQYISNDMLGPLSFPSNPVALGRFGLNAMQPASWISKKFETPEARALWAGMAGHSIQPFDKVASSAIGLVLLAVGNLYGWPIPLGGSQSIADAMVSYFKSIGGKVQTNCYV